MKKICLLFICIFTLVGCNNSRDNENKFYQQYYKYEEKLNNYKDFKETCNEFSIKLVVNKVDDNNTRYDVIIDNPTINMYYLQAIAKVKDDDSRSLPTLGILEDDIFSLVPGVIDKAKGIYKGVNLSGITAKDDFVVLVYITYFPSEKSNEIEERYVKLYGNAT